MSLGKIRARRLLDYSTDELSDMLTGDFTLIFEDGELDVNYRDVILSSVFWEFHREYSNIPLLIEHCVRDTYGDGYYNTKTHLKLLSVLSEVVYDHNFTGEEERDLDFRDHIAKRVNEIRGEIYNRFSIDLGEYASTIDFEDILELVEHPRIKAANEGLKPNPKSIDDAQEIILDVLDNDPTVAKNNGVKMIRSGANNKGQTLQIIGPLGYGMDINSAASRYPILRGYAHGIHSIRETFVESRKSSLSYEFAGDPLKKAEYFSRRLQLVGQSVMNLHHVDCGSDRYLSRKITKKNFKQYSGRYYLDEPSGKLKVVSKRDRSVIGKVLKLRSPMKCAHPDPNGICAICFGTLGMNVPRETNIGNACNASLAQRNSQAMLGTKHHLKTAIIDAIMLGDHQRRFLSVGPTGHAYAFNPNIQHMQPKLIIGKAFINNLGDVYEVEDVTQLNAWSVTSIPQVTLEIKHNAVVDRATLDTKINRRIGSFTHEMLNYLKQYGWTTDNRGNAVVDLSRWDFDDTFMQLPMKQFNMTDFSKEIEKIIESTTKDKDLRDKVLSPDVVYDDLFETVNSRLEVHSSVLECVLYGAMIVSAENYDYGTPKAWTQEGLGVMHKTMQHRSEGALMAFEGHGTVLTSPSSFIYTNRPDHPMDGILIPEEFFRYNQHLVPVQYRIRSDRVKY